MIKIVTKRILYIATLGGILTMCGTAPITPPPAEACSPRLDGKETYCPPMDEELIKLPREEIRGEIDVYDPNHWQQMQYFWLRNARRNEIEKHMTQPEDAINNALLEFNHGSNDTTKSQELLQLQSDGDQEGT
jgi:hypothetical protein